MNGKAIAAVAVGGLFAYGGFRGYSILKLVQNVIQGKPPNQGQNAQALLLSSNSGKNSAASSTTSSTSSGGSGATPVSGNGNNEQILQQTAQQFGWGSGAEWAALQAIEGQEDGSASTTIKNPTSGALGMAQALGHGTTSTAGSLGNEYGGYGLTDSQAQQANSGSAPMQALWMCNYIKDTYGDPIKAEQFHLANGYY